MRKDGARDMAARRGKVVGRMGVEKGLGRDDEG